MKKLLKIKMWMSVRQSSTSGKFASFRITHLGLARRFIQWAKVLAIKPDDLTNTPE